MSIIDQRVIYSNNGTLTDYSRELCDYKAQSVTFAGFTAAEDYIYIGSPVPFNHKYIKMGSTVNALASTISVDLWDGQSWFAAVDVLDSTAASGASFAQDGLLRFTPDRNEAWPDELDSFDVTGLAGTNIYSLYWMRLSFSADLTAGVIVDYIGNRFSDDDDLYSYYPDLNQSSLLTNFEAGKTNWNEQSFNAAEVIIRDLKSRNIIKERGQILDPDTFTEASIHKTAEIIYGSFSQPEITASVRKSYLDSMNRAMHNIDKNSNARLDKFERVSRTGWMRR